LAIAELAIAELTIAELAIAELAIAELAIAELAIAELAIAELAIAELAIAELDIAELDIAELDIAELDIAELDIAELPQLSAASFDPHSLSTTHTHTQTHTHTHTRTHTHCKHLKPYDTTPKSMTSVSTSKLGPHTWPLNCSIRGVLLPLIVHWKDSSKGPSRSDSSFTRMTCVCVCVRVCECLRVCACVCWSTGRTPQKGQAGRTAASRR